MTTWATKHGNRFVCAFGASLLAQSVKQNLPAMQETQVQFLGREDPLEKEMATHPVFLPGNPLNREAWRATVYGVVKESDTA